MSGLVSYGSSDDEEDASQQPLKQEQKEAIPTPKVTNSLILDSEKRPEQKEDVNGNQSSTPTVGPVLGPSIPDHATFSNLQEEEGLDGAPQSPYTASRAALRNLTLPSVPNYDIPQSPPGSPIESTNAKFKQFLKLKKQGVHFNEKLASSAAMKNPSLMQKLMDFADVDELEQYSTTLPKEFWDPQGFPEHAFKEELSKSQQDTLKKKELEKSKGQRTGIDFVSATSSASTSRNGTPSVGSRPAPRSAAERIMAGLDRGRSNSPQTQGVKRKTRFDT